MSEEEKFSKIALENGIFETQLTKKFASRKPYEKRNPLVIQAVIPGVVAEIKTRAGAVIRQGDTLLVLEAMKMLNRVRAPLDGTVKAIRIAAGEKVGKGQVLIELE
jgi:biotin carboxyl carrier protein